MEALVRRIEKLPPQPLGTADSLPVPIQVALARVPLAPAALRGLGVGDVVFLPLPPGDRTQGSFDLWSGGRLLGRATRNRQTFRVSTMNPPAEPSAKPAAGAARVDDLPIPVVFDVGQIELTVGQLRSIGEGYTFELPALPPRLVTLRAHGREIGQGELVELGDKVGVRISPVVARVGAVPAPNPPKPSRRMNFNLPDPLTLIVLTAVLSLAPFFAVMMTSYVKLVVVLSLVRNALGVQQIPPNLVINGLAIILSVYIMAPVATATFAQVEKEDLSKLDAATIQRVLTKAQEPILGFLQRHTNEREKRFFLDTTRKLWSKEAAATVDKDSFLILVPAFTVTELTSAFQIGFLLYLPFIAIDLIVSNILLAMGMMMVSPMTISLPFKLLLFVLVDGWTRLIHGIVLTYAGAGG
jgi:type III secretion protein R